MDKNTKNQSIQDKINEMKKKSKMTDNEKRMKKLKDLSIRSNNKSKLKLSFSNDLSNDKLVIWCMSKELMKYTIINGNEEIIIDNGLYSDCLECIDSMFCDYLDRIEEEELDLENVFIDMEIYEDMNVDNCEVYKKNVIFKNLNMVVAGIYVYQKLEVCEDEDEELGKDTGDLKSNFYKLILKYMVSLEKVRIGESCVCEDCCEKFNEVSIKLTGNENKCVCELNGLKIDSLKMVSSKIGENETREESINNLIKDNIVKKE